VEVPQWRFNRPSAIIGRDASTSDHRGGEKVRTIRKHVPHACASHRVARYVNAMLIDSELAAQSIDDLQR
jgi:hypothetical protein